jgi:glycerol-3-phosphate cytidylyltransferase
MTNKVIGYTTGVFDLFHVGHLNILSKAKENCDHLVVGVTTDELCEKHKGKKPYIPYSERFEIVSAIGIVDQVVAQDTMDKLIAWNIIKFNKMFVGDDWKGTKKWLYLEQEFNKVNVDIIYFSYTKKTSSTKIRNIIDAQLENSN